MDKKTRIQKIEEETKKEPFGRQEIPWKDKLESMETFKIPLRYLIYNKYNGRILSRTKSLERQKYRIDVESEEGCEQIENLLWNSKTTANDKTFKSIKKFGQQKVGIITKDGIIIDGNRRAMILKKANCDYFKTVVLPVTLNENPLEIEKLETSYQMGEDEKLGYNPIEKYIKAKGLYAQQVTIKKISEWMGESISKIQEYLDVMEIMDEYLDYLGYEGIYTQLDNREDQFINLTRWLTKFYKEKITRDGFDGYKKGDIDDLKIISFDYIRAKYEGKEFRIIAFGHRGNHFFGNEEIWKSFTDFHFNNIQGIKDEEGKIDFEARNLEAYLNARDNNFILKSKEFLKDNIEMHNQQLRYNKATEEPLKLITNAEKALESINQKHKSFSKPETTGELLKLNQTITNMLEEKSSKDLLDYIIDLLERFNINKEYDPKENLLEKITHINRISFNIKKKLGG